MSPKETGVFIADLRKEIGITQQELAKKLQVTAKAVSRWETGKGYPDVTILPKISNIFNVSVNEILNGKRCKKDEAEEIAEKTILKVCQQSEIIKRRHLRLLLIIATISIVVISLLCTSIVMGISKSLEGESYAVLSNDFSCLTYYGEQYVPLDMQSFSCRLGEEIVNEVKLENGSIFDKLLSEYTLQSVVSVPNNDLIYLRSENNVDFYVKKSKYDFYFQMLENFEPHTAYLVFEQSDGYEKELSINNNLFLHIRSLTKSDMETSLTCEYKPHRPRMTLIAYNEEKTFYKECGDIFSENNKFYWYDYAEFAYPDSMASKSFPYRIGEQYNESLNTLFTYHD